jgi:hypothetical protein
VIHTAQVREEYLRQCYYLMGCDPGAAAGLDAPAAAVAGGTDCGTAIAAVEGEGLA